MRTTISKSAHARPYLAGLIVTLAVSAHAERGRAELDRFVLNECGFCHGLQLTGGLGGALTPASIAGKSDAVLTAAILAGVPATPMPAWDGILNAQEAQRIVKRLREGLVNE
jgi:cytochrome c55X